MLFLYKSRSWQKYDCTLFKSLKISITYFKSEIHIGTYSTYPTILYNNVPTTLKQKKFLFVYIVLYLFVPFPTVTMFHATGVRGGRKCPQIFSRITRRCWLGHYLSKRVGPLSAVASGLLKWLCDHCY